MNINPTVKVTRIKNRYHARLWWEGKIFDEMACSSKADIGWICREMLRWFDKLGGTSPFASAARKRQQVPAEGKVWYQNQLDKED
jgi:hypothetical protein